MPTPFDSIVIGTGQAGPSLAARLATEGRTVAVIERKLFGGTCVNTGCIPTKTLVASAYAAHLARRAAEFGVVLQSPVAVDMKRVKARKDEISDKSRIGVENWMRHLKQATVIEGHARFISPHEVSVGNEVLTAENIFLNVGARARIPAVPGLGQVPFLTNSSMMAIDFLPRHLVIIGGSYIALEFGQMYRRFGSEVTLIEMGPRVIGREDQETSAAVKEILEKEGVRIVLGAKVTGVAKRGEDIDVSVTTAGGAITVTGSHLLLAVGREPNTDDLGLEAAGVEKDQHGYVVVDDQLRTKVSGIWALGDCNGRGGFTHTSFNDYEIVAANLFDHGDRRVSDRIMTYGLFIDPPLGRAGMTKDEVRRSGRSAMVGHRPMTRVSRAIEKGETEGFMEIIVDTQTKAILGGAILGTGGDEAIHSVLDLMYAKAPYMVMRNAMHIHPTVSELLPTILGELKPLV